MLKRLNCWITPQLVAVSACGAAAARAGCTQRGWEQTGRMLQRGSEGEPPWKDLLGLCVLSRRSFTACLQLLSQSGTRV